MEEDSNAATGSTGFRKATQWLATVAGCLTRQSSAAEFEKISFPRLIKDNFMQLRTANSEGNE
jgi:hypothetical protein